MPYSLEPQHSYSTSFLQNISGAQQKSTTLLQREWNNGLNVLTKQTEQCIPTTVFVTLQSLLSWEPNSV